MASEKHQKQAREITRGTAADTKIPITDAELIWVKIVAALESAYAEGKRDAATRCAEMARLETTISDDSFGYNEACFEIDMAIRAEFGIAVEEKKCQS